MSEFLSTIWSWIVGTLGPMGTSIWNLIDFESKIAIKDAASLALSISSFAISLYLLVNKRRVDMQSAKKEFSQALADLLETRRDIEEIERTNNSVENGETRPLIGSLRFLRDKRDMLVGRAAYFLEELEVPATSHEWIVVAATLIDVGRLGDARRFYAHAISQAKNPYEASVAKRVYGRAEIKSGNVEKGRREMLAAAHGFEELIGKADYEDDILKIQCAETYRRLVAVCLETGNTQSVEKDLIKISDVLGGIANLAIKVNFEKDTEPLQKRWSLIRQTYTDDTRKADTSP